jgi:1-acyl-sn-glycerol-3-phosphate acyltransferase
MFPSGKRAEDGRLGEWKKGAFVLAAELQVPILPIGIIGSQRLHGIGDWFPRPGWITLHIGRPIATTGATYADRDRLLQQARQAVEELLDHAPV